MSASIRGHQGQIKIFKNGALQNIVSIKTADVNQDSSFTRSWYVGQKLPEGDQTVDGWSGSMDLEVKGPEVDDFIDALTTDNLNGIGVEEITVIMKELYSDGTERSYVYFDCQFKMSKHQPSQNEKVTKKLDFQASGRTAI